MMVCGITRVEDENEEMMGRGGNFSRVDMRVKVVGWEH